MKKKKKASDKKIEEDHDTEEEDFVLDNIDELSESSWTTTNLSQKS